MTSDDQLHLATAHGFCKRFQRTHYALGKLGFSMGDAKTASACFKRAFELEPGLWLRALDDAELDRFWEAK